MYIDTELLWHANNNYNSQGHSTINSCCVSLYKLAAMKLQYIQARIFLTKYVSKTFKKLNNMFRTGDKSIKYFGLLYWSNNQL